jgi:hypothetical protein
VGIMQQPA